MTVFERADAALLPGFQRCPVTLDGRTVMALIGGEGPPLLMLHGDPQTHLCWHGVAPALARRHTVVLTDLRGRGESHAPTETAAGPPLYSKRAMAAEQLAVMRALGHDRFSVVAHDRGARVARRLALDHPDAVERLAVLDIIPALDFYEAMTAEIAQDYFYFTFLTQPAPLPESLIQGAPERFMRQILFGLGGGDDEEIYNLLALEAYLVSAIRQASISAMCACFRAGFGTDRAHDRADRDGGRKISCPTLVGWGAQGVVGRHFDVPAVWQRWCEDATFVPFSSGHFIPEHAPDELLDALETFLPSGYSGSGSIVRQCV